jgi:hypothetical protein
MRENGKANALSITAALLVFVVFAAGILSVLLGGAGVYRRLTYRESHSYEHRTAAQYLATKVRQGEAVPFAGEFGGSDALVLPQTIGGEEYLTRVYCYDGWLRELFTPADGHFFPEDGEKILPLASLEIQAEQDLLTFRLRHTDGTETAISLMPRRGKGAQP